MLITGVVAGVVASVVVVGGGSVGSTGVSPFKTCLMLSRFFVCHFIFSFTSFKSFSKYSELMTPACSQRVKTDLAVLKCTDD